MVAPPTLQPHILSRTTDAPPPAGAPLPNGWPLPAQPAPQPVNPTQELVASNGGNLVAQAYAYWARTLPIPGDDLQRDFGLDIYARMGLDPQLRAGRSVLVNGALNAPINLLNPFPADGPVSVYENGETIRKFCAANLDRLDRGIDAILHEVLITALSHGHSVSEILCELVTDRHFGPQLLLRDLKPKPLTSAAFVVDAWGNRLGMFVQRPGMPLIILPVVTSSKDLTQPLVPMSHFAVATWDEQNGDPRGNSIYRACYGFWWMKQQTLPLLLQYKTRFGQPSVVIILPPNAADVPQQDANGAPLPAITATQAMLQVGMDWQGGGVAVVPNGTDPRLMEPNGTGYQVFMDAITMYDNQMVKALLSATLSINEGLHRSGADSTTHQDIVNLSIRAVKRFGATYLKRQLFARLVEWNYGRDALAYLPIVDLGQTDPEDFGPVGQVIAQLKASDFWSLPAQLVELLSVRLGLPYVPGLSTAPPASDPDAAQEPDPSDPQEAAEPEGKAA